MHEVLRQLRTAIDRTLDLAKYSINLLLLCQDLLVLRLFLAYVVDISN